MLSEDNQLQLQQKGISIEEITNQIAFFKKGISYLHIVKPAIPGDGIEVLNDATIHEFVELYDKDGFDKNKIKFVPASGAASRMFKSLFEALSKTDIHELSKEVQHVLEHLKSFAFYPDLVEKLHQNGHDLQDLLKNRQYHTIISYILNKEGLNYGNLPKGLLKFHAYYESWNRTSVEEHLVEGALYAKNTNGVVNIHFTVSPEHLKLFSDLIQSVQPEYEKKFQVTYHISFSIQKPTTDTIAVDEHNQPFLSDDGKLLFRPGGHGALLDNLNDLDGDIIFIKNIDNVVPDRIKNQTILYKKALAGLLMKVQKQTFTYLQKMEQGADETQISEIIIFIEKNIGYRFPNQFLNQSMKEKTTKVFAILNRPIRICGMVKNEGEPGGGPYWVKSDDGSCSLQILESSQFNLHDHKQKEIFNKATHFNPVDLIISTKNYQNKKFQLLQYRDPDTGFISIKSKDGKALKALELPGLWNGSMAFWNTIFVEVPMITFNPVKTINDLLRKEHQ
jgi:hypothetical protein